MEGGTDIELNLVSPRACHYETIVCNSVMTIPTKPTQAVPDSLSFVARNFILYQTLMHKHDVRFAAIRYDITTA